MPERKKRKRGGGVEDTRREKYNFHTLKVHRQCPFSLLVKVLSTDRKIPYRCKWTRK
jgi:hypothetical protein